MYLSNSRRRRSLTTEAPAVYFYRPTSYQRHAAGGEYLFHFHLQRQLFRGCHTGKVNEGGGMTAENRRFRFGAGLCVSADTYW